jgi:hypothetical protein
MDRKIGILWKKSKGNLVANGILENVAGLPLKVSIFINTEKQKPTDPDYELVISKEIPEIKDEQKKDNGGF